MNKERYQGIIILVMKMINNVERIKKLKEENYQKILGIKKNIFDRMPELLNETYRLNI